MQITLDIDDKKTADQILGMLEPYKNKGLKIVDPEPYKLSCHNEPHKRAFENREIESLDEKFKSILGVYAKKRANVSIGEDERILQDALWEKYGQ